MRDGDTIAARSTDPAMKHQRTSGTIAGISSMPLNAHHSSHANMGKRVIIKSDVPAFCQILLKSLRTTLQKRVQSNVLFMVFLFDCFIVIVYLKFSDSSKPFI